MDKKLTLYQKHYSVILVILVICLGSYKYTTKVGILQIYY